MKHHYTYLLIIVILCLLAVCWYGKPEIVPNDTVTQEETMAWHNYRTGKTDYLSEAPKNYRDYIPQQVPVQMIYTLYLEKGLSHQEAAVKTMDIYIKRMEKFNKESEHDKRIKIQRLNK